MIQKFYHTCFYIFFLHKRIHIQFYLWANNIQVYNVIDSKTQTIWVGEKLYGSKNITPDANLNPQEQVRRTRNRK